MWRYAFSLPKVSVPPPRLGDPSKTRRLAPPPLLSVLPERLLRARAGQLERFCVVRHGCVQPWHVLL